jgi:sugar/nucleoside kinase (ribokinase family)
VSSGAPASRRSLDILGIGNALVDVISHEHDAFLEEHGLRKGIQALVDAPAAERLYGAMGSASETSGGSAANTMAGVASFGGEAGFLGRVADDQLGAVYVHDIGAVGVSFPLAAVAEGSPTGRCLIVVTPDAERTMNTFLGAAAEIGPGDVDESVVADADVCYLEGYLFDPPEARLAMAKAVAASHRAGQRVALSLSDPGCVERNGPAILDFLDEVDLLFGNEDELALLFGSDAEAGLAAAALRCDLVVMTRGAAGCVVASGSDRVAVPATPVANVVDTTGAGDLFAAGFLWGLGGGRSLEDCARLGALAAAEVIAHVGARPLVPLAELAAEAELL